MVDKLDKNKSAKREKGHDGKVMTMASVEEERRDYGHL